jgi:hypothetical protein
MIHSVEGCVNFYLRLGVHFSRFYDDKVVDLGEIVNFLVNFFAENLDRICRQRLYGSRYTMQPWVVGPSQ